VRRLRLWPGLSSPDGACRDRVGRVTEGKTALVVSFTGPRHADEGGGLEDGPPPRTLPEREVAFYGDRDRAYRGRYRFRPRSLVGPCWCRTASRPGRLRMRREGDAGLRPPAHLQVLRWRYPLGALSRALCLGRWEIRDPASLRYNGDMEGVVDARETGFAEIEFCLKKTVRRRQESGPLIDRSRPPSRVEVAQRSQQR